MMMTELKSLTLESEKTGETASAEDERKWQWGSRDSQKY